jgi:hypothetical protein
LTVVGVIVGLILVGSVGVIVAFMVWFLTWRPGLPPDRRDPMPPQQKPAPFKEQPPPKTLLDRPLPETGPTFAHRLALVDRRDASRAL